MGVSDTWLVSRNKIPSQEITCRKALSCLMPNPILQIPKLAQECR